MSQATALSARMCQGTFFIEGRIAMDNKVEILAPAGSVESLNAAVAAGADAVYMGGSRFGARAYADNPGEEELLRAVDFVHVHGRKLYLTVNTLLKDSEIDELYGYLLPYYRQGIDGVIVQDIGVAEYIRSYFPDLPLHASTQMTITGAAGAAFMKRQGVMRVVPARELSLAEVAAIKRETCLEVECFVHGALCYCYSGQCLLSSLLGGRSGNRGQCAQPCRLPYSIGDGRPADLMSLKDLCAIDLIPELIEAGIDSFKIEGRMKQPDYVYTVVSMYRAYADLYYEKGREGFAVDTRDRERLYTAYRRRGYCDGYYKRHNGKDMISFSRPQGKEEPPQRHTFEIQEKINGNLILSPGNHAKLELEHKGSKTVCEGMAPEQALKQPLSAERIEKQMRKTGGTQFVFDRLDIRMDGELFLPMQALNELRREGLARLEESLLSPYRRTEDEAAHFTPDEEGRAVVQKSETDRPAVMAVSVMNAEQLKAAVSAEEIRAIYVDSGMLVPAVEETLRSLVQKAGESGKEVYAALPYIFRSPTAEKFEQKYALLLELFDGVLVRNWESCEWLEGKGYDRKIISDANIYVFNRYAKQFLKKTRIESYTAPAELNAGELKELGVSDCTFVAYGYQPVMVTAGCVQKTTGRCTHSDGLTYIKDRYQKKFAVKNCCEYCYNIIYNSSPLVLLNQRKEINSLSPASIRLDFTTEDAKEMQKITALYTDAFIKEKDIRTPDMDFTKGHFKRGVK